MTPHTARPAPSATTSVCKIEIAELKNAIFHISKTADFSTFLGRSREGQILHLHIRPSYTAVPESPFINVFIPAPAAARYSVVMIPVFPYMHLPPTLFYLTGTSLSFLLLQHMAHTLHDIHRAGNRNAVPEHLIPPCIADLPAVMPISCPIVREPLKALAL